MEDTETIQQLSRGTITPPNEECPLLAQPPELRTMIWSEAILDADEIKVDDDWCRPGILQASRQTQVETTSMYFRQNRFAIESLMLGCDVDLRDLAIQWLGSLPPSDVRNLQPIRISGVEGLCIHNAASALLKIQTDMKMQLNMSFSSQALCASIKCIMCNNMPEGTFTLEQMQSIISKLDSE